VAEGDLETFCLGVANTLMLERMSSPPGDLVPPGDVDEPSTDSEFGSQIPAGYTYFGQLIDHDITFDPASDLQRRNDSNRLPNFRTPRLDLDCVYGRGPADQPYLYDTEDPAMPAGGSPIRFLIGRSADANLRDLPRNGQRRALIGDMRNDENAVVCQLQLAFLLAHNTLVQRALDNGEAEPFLAAQQTLRWLYQWIVWHDFLGRVVDTQIHDAALTQTTAPGGRVVWERGLKDLFDWKYQPFMPVEFSVAAYRFGHSMVRNSYQTNNPHRGFQVFAPIFDNTPGASGDDLRGFRPLVKTNAIQWDWFLQMTTSAGPFPQHARRIDTRLANALAFLHEGAPGSPMNVLASRNLLRGIQFELPSGPDVARKLGLTPVALGEGEPAALWYYVLKEAADPSGAAGQRLGPVGSFIVAAVFSGLLHGDPRSWLNVAPAWTPDQDPLLQPGTDNVDDPQWGLPALIRLAGLPVDDGDVTAQS
jgi:hypothetical protein